MHGRITARLIRGAIIFTLAALLPLHDSWGPFIEVDPAVLPAGSNPPPGRTSGPPRSPQMDRLLQRWCSLPESTAFALWHRRSTRDPLPSCCDTRPVRTPGRTMDGMDGLSGNVSPHCYHAV